MHRRSTISSVNPFEVLSREPIIKKIKIIIIIGLFSIAGKSEKIMAQMPKDDTLNLTISKAEELFVKNNLLLLAQKLNVDASQALILQAKLYPNPTLGAVQGAYNPDTKKWFEQDYPNGERAYQFSQLIVLSRKIHKQVKIAETNYKLAEDNLYDLLRTLKLALRSSFFNIHYLEKTAWVYDEEINALKTILSAYHQVEGKGYVSETEIVQVQAQLYSLQNENQVLKDNLNDQQSQMRLLLQVNANAYVHPIVDDSIVNNDPVKFSLQALLDSAYVNRTDLMIAKDNLLLSQQTYTYQRALAIPDLTLGAGYDWRGSYIPDANLVSLGIDIPIFNRNQGNIKNAFILIDFNKTQLDITQKTLDEQVTRGLQKAIDADILYKGIDPTFANKFDTLAMEMMKNYLKRNVSLLTFLTFYDSYKQNIVQLNSILFNKVNALENINFLTGTEFFNK